MKKTILTSFLIVMLLSFLIGGATMAYFYDEKDIQEGKFEMTLGEVDIDVREGTQHITIEPEETAEVEWEIINKGTATVWLRVELNISPDDNIVWDIVSEDWDDGFGDEYYYYTIPVEEGDCIPVTFEITGTQSGNASLTLDAYAVQTANNVTVNGPEAWDEE